MGFHLGEVDVVHGDLLIEEGRPVGNGIPLRLQVGEDLAHPAAYDLLRLLMLLLGEAVVHIEELRVGYPPIAVQDHFVDRKGEGNVVVHTEDLPGGGYAVAGGGGDAVVCKDARVRQARLLLGVQALGEEALAGGEIEGAGYAVHLAELGGQVLHIVDEALGILLGDMAAEDDEARAADTAQGGVRAAEGAQGLAHLLDDAVRVVVAVPPDDADKVLDLDMDADEVLLPPVILVDVLENSLGDAPGVQKLREPVHPGVVLPGLLPCVGIAVAEKAHEADGPAVVVIQGGAAVKNVVIDALGEEFCRHIPDDPGVPEGGKLGVFHMVRVDVPADLLVRFSQEPVGGLQPEIFEKAPAHPEIAHSVVLPE